MLKNEAEKLKELLLKEAAQKVLQAKQEQFLREIDVLTLLRDLANNRDKRQWAIETLSEYAALSVYVPDEFILGRLFQEACWRINGQYKQELLTPADYVVLRLYDDGTCYEAFFMKGDHRYVLGEIDFEDADA